MKSNMVIPPPRTGGVLLFLVAGFMIPLQLAWAPNRATINVSDTADLVADDGLRTLREAIVAANTNMPSGGMSSECPAGQGRRTDIITLANGATYSLSIGSSGDIPQDRIEWTPPSESLAFTHGVASSEVTASSALLWTRVNQSATHKAQVSTEPAFVSIIFQQDVTITPETDYTARVLAGPLGADNPYYYRWLSGDITSPTGAFRTAPGEPASDPVRFAFSGDSDGTRVLGQPFFNHFEALDAARQDSLDFFVCLGDTVYSDSPLRLGGLADTLEEYRQTYQDNREVAALPDLLAAASIYAIWDDHERKARNRLNPRA